MTNQQSPTQYREIFDRLEQKRSEIKKQQNILENQLKSLSSIAKVLNELDTFLDKGWYLHILELLEKNKNLLTEDKVNDSTIIKSLEEIKIIAIEKSIKANSHLFPRYMQEACKEAEIKIDSDSRHPIYKFNQSFFEVKVDENKQRIRLSNYESSKAINIPADIPAIIYYLQQEQKRIFDRAFDGKDFLKKLRTEYLALIRKDQANDGSSILIRSIFKNLKTKEQSFSSDEFLVDLSKLVQEGQGEIDGRKFELQQIRDREKGLLLHGTLSPTYVGFILFKKV